MQYEIRKVDDELTHYGRQGMHWGIRQYQYKDGSLTPLGRIHYGYKTKKEAMKKWAIRQKEKSDERKQKNEEKKQQRKEYLIEYGTPKEISKNMNKFSNDDLIKIQNRFSTEIKVRENIEKLSPSKKVPDTKPTNDKNAKNKDSVDKSISKGTKFLSENTENMAKTVGNAKTFYNTVAVINNSLRRNPAGNLGLHAGDHGYIALIR